jgi:hypothetical protein
MQLNGPARFFLLDLTGTAVLCAMHDRELEYRRQAEQARRLAARELQLDDRRFWLGLADQWDDLAERTAKSDAREHQSSGIRKL